MRYLSLQTHNAHDIRAHNQMLDQYTNAKVPTSAHKVKSINNQEYVYVEGSDSTLPWRKPPHPKPKDWPYTSNSDKKTPPVTPATPVVTEKAMTTTTLTSSTSKSVTKSKRSSVSTTKKTVSSHHWQSPTLHNIPTVTRVQDIPKPPLPIEIPITPFDFIPPPLPSERNAVVLGSNHSPVAPRVYSPVPSPKQSKHPTYQQPSSSPRRPPTGSQYGDIHQSSLNGIWLDEHDNYSTNNNFYNEYFELHSDLDMNNEAFAMEGMHRKVRVNTTHVPLTPIIKQAPAAADNTNYKSQSPYGLLRSIQSKLLNLSNSPRNNNMDNNMEELHFPPSYPIPRSSDDSGSISFNNDIKEALHDLVQRKRNTLELLKSKH